MRRARTLILAGAAAAALLGAGAVAAAQTAKIHTMTVKAPDGAEVTIRYSGDAAPKVSFDTVPAAADFARFDAPFAAMARISQQMQRRMEESLRAADAMLAAMPDRNPVFRAGFGAFPFDMPALSAAAGGGKGGFCMRSVEIVSAGRGAPKVTTHTAGDCGGAGAAAAHQPAGTGPRTAI